MGLTAGRELTPSSSSSNSSAPANKKPRGVTPSLHRTRGVSKPESVTMSKPKRRTAPKPNALQPRPTVRRDSTSSAPVTPVPNKRPRVEDNPLNYLVKTLRQHQGMSWDQICAIVNDQRPPGSDIFTPAAAYSRFVRNAPILARASGEVGFDPKDYMHLRHPHHYPTAGFLGNADSRLTQHMKRNPHGLPKEMRGNVRSNKVDDESELESEVRQGMLKQAFQIAADNFWTVVADHMEKASGVLFTPEVLQRKYTEIVEMGESEAGFMEAEQGSGDEGGMVEGRDGEHGGDDEDHDMLG
ncbi:hypothetical protein M011DRAFT_481989 [Sporormia fimetaria CBS 119925]|uniref:Uncharacterized protein n=1 Tax=Sporormia fimetaria CBS 119925 TaxID=1340428 RepID=A0A6A6UYE5_9PLEO|nr:hypothetical protein M011DRAFT_481989 [Sporormia fimetaria CBS 119925]